MDAVNEIKNRADIVELISKYTVLTRSGKTMKGLCPFHSEKHGSFFVYPESGTWHCFGACASGGDVFSFIMKKEGLNFSEALERLSETYGVVLPNRSEASTHNEHRNELAAANTAAALYFHDLLLNSPLAAKARAYLAKRGVNAGSIEDFQIGYALPDWQALKDHLNSAGYADDTLVEAGLLGQADSGRLYDRFRHQIIFPISDARGKIAGFGARVLDDSQPKYLNSPETPLFSKSGALYGINLAAQTIRVNDAAIIVEGYFDVIISHQFGFKNTIGSMGTAVNEQQVAIIKKLSPNLIIAFDADAAGEAATARCVSFENLLGREIKVVLAPPGKDPDDAIRANPSAWEISLGNARPIVDFVFDMAASKFDLRTARGKAGLTERLLPVVAEIKDPVRRGHYLAILAGKVGTSPSELQYSLSRQALLRSVGKSAIQPPNESPSALHGNACEDYLLAILLKHPSIIENQRIPDPEIFQSLENKEIIQLLLKYPGVESIRDKLDSFTRTRFDLIAGIRLDEKNVALKFQECCRRLEKEYLRTLLIKIQEAMKGSNSEGSADGSPELTEYISAIAGKLAELDAQDAIRRRAPKR